MTSHADLIAELERDIELHERAIASHVKHKRYHALLKVEGLLGKARAELNYLKAKGGDA